MYVHVYHFPLLNHIRHGERVNFPFYLLSSLHLNIEKGASPPLHQGLMLALYKHALVLNPHGNPLVAQNCNQNHNEEDNEDPFVVANPSKEPIPFPLSIVAGRRVLIPTNSPSTLVNQKTTGKGSFESNLVKATPEKRKHSPLLLELPNPKKL